LTAWLLLSVSHFAGLMVPTTCGPNKRLDGASATRAIPVPLRLIICGLFFASSVIAISPLRVPIEEGLKLTLIVQLVGPRLPLHLLVARMKSPPTATFVTFRFLNRLLTRMAFCAGLVVPTT
jgi:hypothetical protein